MMNSKHQKRVASRPAGLTLVELVVVLAILIALAGVALPNLQSMADSAREQATLSSAVEVRDAVLQFWSDCKYSARGQRIQLGQLLELPAGFTPFDPNVRLGWNGPYLQSDGGLYTVNVVDGFTTVYGNADHLAIRDAFSDVGVSGLPFVIQEPTLVNLGPTETYEVGELREVRVVSAGPDGQIDIDESLTASQLEADPSRQGDDIYVTFLLR